MLRRACPAEVGNKMLKNNSEIIEVNTKKTIRKILFVAMWFAIGGGMLVLLIAAMGKQKKNTCKDYSITIKGGEEKVFFLSKADVMKLLKAAAKGNIKGQPKASFNLQQ